MNQKLHVNLSLCQLHIIIKMYSHPHLKRMIHLKIRIKCGVIVIHSLH